MEEVRWQLPVPYSALSLSLVVYDLVTYRYSSSRVEVAVAIVIILHYAAHNTY